MNFSVCSIVVKRLKASTITTGKVTGVSGGLIMYFYLKLKGTNDVVIKGHLNTSHLRRTGRMNRALAGATVVTKVMSNLILVTLSPFVAGVMSLAPATHKCLRGVLLVSSCCVTKGSMGYVAVKKVFTTNKSSGFKVLYSSMAL